MARARLQDTIQVETPQNPGVSPCRLQLTLAQVELQLGNHDDALLALFEIERLTCTGEEDVDQEAESLRRQIPDLLILETSKDLARRRAEETDQFMEDLRNATSGLKLL